MSPARIRRAVLPVGLADRGASGPIRARRSRARSSRRGCGSGGDDRRGSAGSRSRGTRAPPSRAPRPWAGRPVLRRSRGPLDQVEQLVLHLGGEPPEDRELDAALLAAQMPPSLGEGADRPLAVAEDLPGEQLLRRDDDAGQLGVAVEVGLDVADAPEAAGRRCRSARRGRAARRDPPPGRRRARTPSRARRRCRARRPSRLPIRKSPCVDDPGPLEREPLPAPGEPELDRRMRLVDRVELGVEPLPQVAAPAGTAARRAGSNGSSRAPRPSGGRDPAEAP